MDNRVLEVLGCFNCPFNVLEYGKTASGRLTFNMDYAKRKCIAVKDPLDIKIYHVLGALNQASCPKFCPLKTFTITIKLESGAGRIDD